MFGVHAAHFQWQISTRKHCPNTPQQTSTTQQQASATDALPSLLSHVHERYNYPAATPSLQAARALRRSEISFSFHSFWCTIQANIESADTVYTVEQKQVCI